MILQNKKTRKKSIIFPIAALILFSFISVVAVGVDTDLAMTGSDKYVTVQATVKVDGKIIAQPVSIMSLGRGSQSFSEKDGYVTKTKVNVIKTSDGLRVKGALCYGKVTSEAVNTLMKFSCKESAIEQFGFYFETNYWETKMIEMSRGGLSVEFFIKEGVFTEDVLESFEEGHVMKIEPTDPLRKEDLSSDVEKMAKAIEMLETSRENDPMDIGRVMKVAEDIEKVHSFRKYPEETTIIINKGSRQPAK